MLYHYADLKAQGYRAGRLAEMVVACGAEEKDRLITSKRSAVTCPRCAEHVRTLEPETPVETPRVSLVPKAKPETTPVTPDQFPPPAPPAAPFTQEAPVTEPGTVSFG